MSKGILISEKHGVNPSIQKCRICGDSIGVILFGKLKDDREAPREVHHDTCDKCKQLIDEGGIALIEVRDSDPEYRTGRLWFIKREAAGKIFSKIDFDKIKVFMIPEKVSSQIGLLDLEGKVKNEN